MTMRGIWTAYEAAAATGGALCARPKSPSPSPDDGRWTAEDWVATGLSIDTRTLAPGEMFVALKDARDGHDFVRQAFDSGASAALVSRAPDNAPSDKPLLVVRDTLEGLCDLARAARARNFGKRIGVTGSAGKTSTKEMLRCALAPAGAVHAADKSFNNHLGVPLTLAQTPMGADFGVYEIGMNHAGEITPLTQLVQPDVAIVTTVGQAHLENLGSIENIAEAKAEIFRGVPVEGAAVLPIDNDHYERLRVRAAAAGIGRIVTFGAAQEADARLLDYRTDGVVSQIQAELFGERLTFTLGAPGRHQAMNALAVLAAVHLVSASTKDAAEALASFGAAPGRGARIPLTLPSGRAILLLDESYNANPASARAALEILGATPAAKGARRIVVFGDMLELGPDAERLHAALATPIVEAGVAKVYAAGPLSAALWAQLPGSLKALHEPERGEAAARRIAEALLATLEEGDIVMVKGSNASKVHAVVDCLRRAGETAAAPGRAGAA